MERLRRRRRAGAGLLAAVLLVALAVPRLLPQPVGGTAVLAPVPGPPAVGDCVSPPAGGWNADPVPRGELTYPPATTRPCAFPRGGEVIAVIPAAEVARPSAARADSASDADRNADRCSAELNGYLGLAAASSPVAQTAWQPLATLTTAVAGPTALQRAFGQHWLSCIAYVAGVDGTGVSYGRSLRAGYTSGRLPGAAAQCLLTADPQLPTPVPCSTPHRAELFGAGWSATPVTALTPTCRQLVQHLTGMPDPTAAGELTVETAQQRVQIVTFGVDASGTSNFGRTTGEMLIPVCLVVVTAAETASGSSAVRALAGPLVDLGTAPVPWA